MAYRLRPAHVNDLPDILAITNQAIAETDALWISTPMTLKQRHDWLMERQKNHFPVLVVVDKNETILGFGSYGPFRAYEGYKNTVEHSIYATPSAQGHGLGRLLLEGLIDEARRQKLHVMIGAITGGNIASIRLHEKCGFLHGGLLPETGTKNERWLDLVLMYLKI